MEQTLTTPRKFSRLPTYDTSLWRAAVVYAQALIGAVEAEKATETVLGEFDALIDDVLDKLPKLEAVWNSSFVEEDAKEAMLQKAFADRVSPVFLSFLKVVARHGRLDMLRLIHHAFHEEYDKVRNRVRVMIGTAEPLDSKAEERILQEIRDRMHLQPVLEKEIHPDLIGGIVLRVGDRVYDGSIATQLKGLREQMVNRSVHEIQSRRDRFSSSK
jgi:F-type H+-transporting ATPase subunit delta